VLPALTDAVKAAIKTVRAGSGAETLELDISGRKVSSFTPGVPAFGISEDPGWYALNGWPRFASAFSGGQSSHSGEVVNLRSALNHSVVYACNKLISETAGSTPLAMLQEKNGAKQLATDKPMYSAMRNAPNDEMTAMTFRETRTSHKLLEGNGFSLIERRSGTGVAQQLQALDPGRVKMDREKTGQRRLVYIVDNGPGDVKTYTVQAGKPHDILHLRGIGWDGLRGYSVIDMARQSFGTALATERHVGRFYANGGRTPYNLELSKKFDDERAFDKFRAEWEEIYSNPHKVPIIEPWFKYQQIGLNAVDSQMLESRLFGIHEICRWFLVSPHLVGDLSRATFSNIEQLALEFVKVTMNPHYTAWEQDLWRCVLTPEEKSQGYYFKHNTNELLRGDFLTRMQGYSIQLQNGIASPNEIRDLEDWNPFPGGDAHHIQLNMQTVPAQANPDGSQSPALVRISE
jgi:HK97 family phage portal protein